MCAFDWMTLNCYKFVVDGVTVKNASEE